MKSFFNISKWIVGQIRPFILSLTFIILLGAFGSLSSVGFAIASKSIIDAVTEGNLSRAAIIGFVFLIIVIINIVIHRIDSILSGHILEAITNSLRRRVFNGILHSNWRGVSKYHSGDLLTRMTSDIGVLSNVIVNVVPSMVSLGVQFIGAFIVLILYEPALALTACILGPAGVIFSRLFGRKLKKLHIRLQETEGEYRSKINEAIQNLIVVKAFGLEDRNISLVENIQEERLQLVASRSRASSGVNAVLSAGYWLGYLISFSVGAYLISKGTGTFGTFTAFIQLIGQVQWPFEGLAYKLPQLISASASAERLMELEFLDMEEEHDRLPQYSTPGIEFQNIAFKYDSNKPVLDNVSFKIYPGEIAAIIGPSGEGKTTIIRLILALILPEYGQIYFSSAKGDRILCNPSCRKLISYVPQGNTLFSGSIRENLYLGNSDANEFELIKALKDSSAWEFIEELPDGMETVIGERGIGLSEGQAQRIAIARALIRKTPILIFDEATSALDMDTEMKILTTIKGLKENPTCIIITHRVSVMKACNKVLNLKAGKIIEYDGGVILNPSSEAI